MKNTDKILTDKSLDKFDISKNKEPSLKVINYMESPDGGADVDIEVNDEFIEFVRVSLGKKKITKSQLTSYINDMFDNRLKELEKSSDDELKNEFDKIQSTADELRQKNKNFVESLKESKGKV